MRELCDEREALLIIDEVQTGLGRTGRWFGFEHSGVKPDIVTMAKALGNGVPIGACWARADVAAAFAPGDHATTFGGQPLAARAALAVLDVMERDGVPERAARAGTRLVGVAGRSSTASPRCGARACSSRPSSRPAYDAKDIAQKCLDRGLVVNAVTPSALRFAPPLLVSDAEIDEAVAPARGCAPMSPHLLEVDDLDPVRLRPDPRQRGRVEGRSRRDSVGPRRSGASPRCSRSRRPAPGSRSRWRSRRSAAIPIYIRDEEVDARHARVGRRRRPHDGRRCAR